MTIDKAKVEFFLKELRKRGKEITGGTPGKKRPSYELRDPEYYWDFGSFLVEQAQQVDEDQRHTWIRRQTINIEKDNLLRITSKSTRHDQTNNNENIISGIKLLADWRNNTFDRISIPNKPCTSFFEKRRIIIKKAVAMMIFINLR